MVALGGCSWVRCTCRVGYLLSVWVVCTPTPTYLAQGTPARTPAHLPTYLSRARAARPRARRVAGVAGSCQPGTTTSGARRCAQCTTTTASSVATTTRLPQYSESAIRSARPLSVGRRLARAAGLWVAARSPPAPLPTYCWLRGRPQSRAYLPTRLSGSLTTASLPGKCTEPCIKQTHSRPAAGS